MSRKCKQYILNIENNIDALEKNLACCAPHNKDKLQKLKSELEQIHNEIYISKVNILHISSKSLVDTTNDDTVIEKEIISDKNIVDQNGNNIQSTHINITTDKVYARPMDSYNPTPA